MEGSDETLNDEKAGSLYDDDELFSDVSSEENLHQADQPSANRKKLVILQPLPLVCNAVDPPPKSSSEDCNVSHSVSPPNGTLCVVGGAPHPDDTNSVEDLEYDEDTDGSSFTSYDSPVEGTRYEHALRHISLYETPRKRRRRHLHNRASRYPPPLHFTGTERTEFWKCYGVEPSELMEPGNTHGVDTMFTDEEYKKLGESERRLHVNGQKFKIVSNEDITENMSRAICHALGMPEDLHKRVCAGILQEIVKHWPMFSTEVLKYCGRTLTSKTRNPNPTSTVDNYNRHHRNKMDPPEFELTAAALHFGFTYAVIEIGSTNDKQVVVRNCENKTVLKDASAKYHFLKSGTFEQPISYEFLLPIGPLKRIHDGKYPSRFLEVFLVEKLRTWRSSADQPKKFRSSLGPIPSALGLDHRSFFHRSTVSHDLWSLLAELLPKRLMYAPDIKRKVIDSKHNFALYYLACKAKKQYQLYGRASAEKIAEEFGRRFSREYPRGDVEDLQEAAVCFDFSYTLIGMDTCGNFYWKDHVSSLQVEKKKGSYFAFFAKTAPDKTIFWYTLEDPGRSCPLERSLYYNGRLPGDMSHWSGKFYFHYAPEVNPLMKLDLPVSSRHNFFSAPTTIISQAKAWASQHLLRLGTTIAEAASTITTKHTTRSIVHFVTWARSRRKVNPDNSDKNVKALFVRDVP